MSREWHPGDVAMVTLPGGGVGRMFRGVCGWIHVEGRLIHGADTESARPLIVIDPEDEEQVDRLADLIYGYMPDGCTHPTHFATSEALREFADPKPPKPEEPTGLGAVVEDAEGDRWIRTGEDPEDCYFKPWQNGPVHRNWQIVGAVRVLSEGVQA